MHADDDPVDVRRLARAGQYPLQPRALPSMAVPADIRIDTTGVVPRHVVTAIRAEPAVLQAYVVVVQRHDQRRADREGIPVACELRTAVRWQVESRQIRQIPLRAIACFVLMVSQRWHPGTVPR